VFFHSRSGLLAAVGLALLAVAASPASSSSHRGDSPVNSAGPGSVVWVGDYGARDVGEIWTSQEKSAADRIAVIDDPEQGKVLRYEIRNGETAGITGNERVETRDPRVAGGQPWRGRNGQTWWFGWRFWLSPNFETQSNFNILTQWKGWNPDTGTPAFALTAGRTLRLKAGTQAGQVLVWRGANTAAIKGRWQDIVVRLKVSNRRDGRIEIWSGEAGKLRRQTNLAGHGRRWIGRTLHAGYRDQHLIFKQGIYRDANAFAGTSEHRIKAPRIGRSFAAVAPR
jgi:hypothetical protein